MAFNDNLEPNLNSPNEISTQMRIKIRIDKKRMDKLAFLRGGDKKIGISLYPARTYMTVSSF